MQKEKMCRLGRDVIYLIKQALHEAAPDPKILIETDFPDLYKMARFHSVEACIYLPLKKAKQRVKFKNRHKYLQKDRKFLQELGKTCDCI